MNEYLIHGEGFWIRGHKSGKSSLAEERFARQRVRDFLRVSSLRVNDGGDHPYVCKMLDRMAYSIYRDLEGLGKTAIAVELLSQYRRRLDDNSQDSTTQKAGNVDTSLGSNNLQAEQSNYSVVDNATTMSQETFKLSAKYVTSEEHRISLTKHYTSKFERALLMTKKRDVTGWRKALANRAAFSSYNMLVHLGEKEIADGIQSKLSEEAVHLPHNIKRKDY